MHANNGVHYVLHAGQNVAKIQINQKHGYTTTYIKGTEILLDHTTLTLPCLYTSKEVYTGIPNQACRMQT